jgi:isopentenyl diphosphate isomerase/L-lactate dehydrogenase-like FMN-dependent dehydrogenase
MIGRPYVYGLAVGGGRGVGAVLALLAEEIRKTLLLMGVARVADLGREHLVPAS